MITEAQWHKEYPTIQDEHTKAMAKLLDIGIALNEPVQPSSFFRVSFISQEPCERAIVLSSVSTPERRNTTHFYRIMSDGTYRHKKFDAWLRAIKEAGHFKELEIEREIINHDYWVSGHIDAICGTFTEEPLSLLGSVLIDFKGMNNEQFNLLKTPLRKHYLQTQLYMYFAHIDNGMVIYENKNNNRRKIYRFEKHPEHIDPILKRMKDLMEYRNQFQIMPNNKNLPPRQSQSWCNTCDFKKACLFYKYGVK